MHIRWGLKGLLFCNFGPLTLWRISTSGNITYCFFYLTILLALRSALIRLPGECGGRKLSPPNLPIIIISGSAFLFASLCSNNYLIGSNGVCAGRVCPHGGECVASGGRGVCRCPRCSNEFAPVCGSDGISYGNRCKLQLEACRHRRDVQVLYDGPCSEYFFLAITSEVLVPDSMCPGCVPIRVYGSDMPSTGMAVSCRWRRRMTKSPIYR